MQMSHMSMLWTVCACHDLDIIGYHDNQNKQIQMYQIYRLQSVINKAEEMQLLKRVYWENVCFIIPVEIKP